MKIVNFEEYIYNICISYYWFAWKMGFDWELARFMA